MFSKLSINIICFLLLLKLEVFAQGKEKIPADLYKASTIPDSLKENAESVVRYSYVDIEVKGPGRATLKEHKIVTLLTEKAEEEATFFLHYDKFNTINRADIKVMSADGTVTKKYSKSDMYDRAALDNTTIVSDSRIKFLRHTVSSYPTTLEIITEETLNSFLHLDDWTVVRPRQAVQESIYKIAADSSAKLKYKTYNFAQEPVKSTNQSTVTYIWKLSGIKAPKWEEGALSWRLLPKIAIAPEVFKYDGREGSMSSWQSFGKWIKRLNDELPPLSPTRIAEIKKMTEGLATDKEKAKFLYEYLQKNMRYVSIQLGIGGLKPFAPSFVDQKKYGDCKALSFYMLSLLKAVDIPSYYTVIRAGENEDFTDPDFVIDRANHIILCIPFKNDTTWLECTSNTQPFGRLGTSTENRYALLIKDDGGELVRTPDSRKEDNRFDSESTIRLHPTGAAEGKIKVHAKGEYRDMYLYVSSLKKDDQKTFLIRNLNIKQPDIFDLSHGEDKDGIKEVSFDLEYSKFSDMAAGDKFFYRPVLLDIWSATFPELKNRKTDFYFSHPLIKTNTTTIEVPENFEVGSLPGKVSLKFSHGSYESDFAYDKTSNKITGTSKFELDHHIIPATGYTEMQQFMEEVSKSLKKKLVLKKKV